MAKGATRGPKRGEDEREIQDEVAVLKRWLELSAREATLKRALKQQAAELDALAYKKYPTLSDGGDPDAGGGRQVDAAPGGGWCRASWIASRRR